MKKFRSEFGLFALIILGALALILAFVVGVVFTVERERSYRHCLDQGGTPAICASTKGRHQRGVPSPDVAPVSDPH